MTETEKQEIIQAALPPDETRPTLEPDFSYSELFPGLIESDTVKPDTFNVSTRQLLSNDHILEGKKADKATTLAGYGITDANTKSETETALAGKADKADTLAGYGITDAYTKTEANAAITDEVAKIVSNAPAKFDTLKEIADWIADDETQTANVVADINTLKTGKANAGHSHTYSEITGTPSIPTKVSQLTNDSNYLTGITKAQVVNALGYTPPTQDTNTTYSAATQSAAGLMTAADKKKLDGIAAEANAYSLPGTVSFTNLTVTGALNIPGGKIWIE